MRQNAIKSCEEFNEAKKLIQLLGEPIDVNRSPIKDYVLPTLVLLNFQRAVMHTNARGS